MVKHKDIGEYLCYIYLYTMRKQYIVYEANESLYMRRKRGWSTYYMRCWLRLLQCSWSYHHYPLPYSMLHPWGINCNIYLQKLSGRLQLCAHSLPINYILCSLMEPKANDLTKLHLLSLGFLSKHQCQLIKGPIVNMDNYFNENFPSFDPFNSEFSLGYRIIDTFSSHFSFHSFSKCNKDSLKFCVHRLDKLAIESLNNPSHTLVIMDISIKNNITISISHIHIHNRSITKTLHHAVNVLSIKAKLFAIRCGINQTTNSCGISKIIVITDSIHAVKFFFDLSFHPYQSYIAFIFKELQAFFSFHQENSIKFWECPSCCNWSLHKVVDIKTKLFNLIPFFSRKSS